MFWGGLRLGDCLGGCLVGLRLCDWGFGGWWLVVGSGIGGPPSSDCVAGGAYRILRLGDWGSMRRVRGWRLGDWEGLRRVLDFATGRLGIRPADFATGRLGNENF